MGRSLVAIQIGLAVPLLIVGGLLIRSIDRLEGQPLAVNRHVLAVDFGPSLTNERVAPQVVRGQLLDAVRALPHVADATFASQTPLGGSMHGSSLRVEGQPPRDDRSAVAAFVGPGYFRTVGIPLVAGRDFTDEDVSGGRLVAVLSETAAGTFLPGTHAIGQRVAYGSRGFAEVVGVARDVKFLGLRTPSPRQIFLPQLQNGGYGGRLVVRADGDPSPLALAVRAAIRRAAPDLPIVRMTSLDEEIRASTATDHALAVTASMLAAAALLVSGVGVGALTGYTVARRTREFGIRLALGATAPRVMRSVMASALRAIAPGGIIGLLGAFATARLVESTLYEVSPSDPAVLTAVTAAVLVTVCAASLVPAVRASHVDPVVALRIE